MDAYLIDAVRTPFGKHRGGLAGIRTDDLAALPLAELVRRQPALNPATIDDVILGDTNGAGEDNRNVARMAALLAGLPPSVPAVTVNRLCASGGEAIVQATRAIRAGDADLVIAGGVESMTRAPFVLPKPDVPFPTEAKLYHTQVGWRMVNPRFPREWTASLGACAEAVAHDLGITRNEQDDWAMRSHHLAAAAWEAGLHDEYVMPVADVRRDESIRPDTTLDKLAGLKPAFSESGSVTAGNASPINDGAIAVLVASEAQTTVLEAQPLGRIVAAATVALEPHRFTLAPVGAIRKVLARAGLAFGDIAVWEINEAFAAMVLSCLQELPEIDRELVNPNGGAIAIGHPLGASVPRVVVDACRELRRRGGGYAVAAACVGVGQGTAMVVRVD
ncbi:thiolase family protein [Planosporangium thailandense]|uniref:Probable acetyl-CoA acetyltransferase n=1 Tax=Planosporangium thailandense TaxID=765197 RepID=A0ABX0XTD9_9ACTN|nr:thiolase family protein [Planosporangium thailandense]